MSTGAYFFYLSRQNKIIKFDPSAMTDRQTDRQMLRRKGKNRAARDKHDGDFLHFLQNTKKAAVFFTRLACTMGAHFTELIILLRGIKR